MEMAIRNAIWEMLASGYEKDKIIEGFSLVDIEWLIEDVNEDYQEEINDENN